MRQNGQSIYKINDRAVTRQQISNLLSLAKIDPDGYNIILQGDIIKLVEMHPDERRILIEDIAGISIYEDKKHKAMLELDKVEQHLKETEIVLAERSTYLRELKKDRDQAMKYKEMGDKIKQNKASYLKIQIDKKESEKKDIREKIEAGNIELSKLREKIIKLKQENTLAYLNRGSANLLWGRCAEAIKDFDVVISRNDKYRDRAADYRKKAEEALGDL